MGLNNKRPGAVFVNRKVKEACEQHAFLPLLGQYGGENSPGVPLILEWLEHIESTHESQHEVHERELKKALEHRTLHPESRYQMGCPANSRLWDLLESLWGSASRGSDSRATGALSPRRIVELYLARARIGVEQSVEAQRAFQLPALLINTREPNEANKGRVVALHLTRLSAADWEGCAVRGSPHGWLVRAPGAYLLDLDHEFMQAVQRVEQLLARTLAPLAAGEAAQVLSWSLRPLPWPGEEERFNLSQVGGASLGGLLALASLHLMEDQLAPDVSRHWREQLRELDLASLTATAALGQPPNSDVDPLDWPLDFIGGATWKLTELKQFLERKASRSFNTDAVLLRKDQGVVGNQHPPLLDGLTLADWVRKAHARSGIALGQRLRVLHSALLDLPLCDYRDLRSRASLPPGLLDHEFAVELPAPAGPDAEPAPLRAALRACLLQRFAHWAGGHHQPFGSSDGQPVLLASHFLPIEIQPMATTALDSQGRLLNERPTLRKKEEVNGLADLLSIERVDRWLCTAAPAGGKTTLLAAFEMETAHAAIQRLNHTGRFGTVALWLPLRWCATALVHDAPAAMSALWDLAIRVYPAWSRPLRQAAEHGDWTAFKLLGTRVVWLLDGVNEMPARSQSHRAQLIGWMDELLVQLAAASGGCIAQRVYTVRTQARQGMLPTVNEAVLQPWDQKRRRDYMLLRLGAEHPQLPGLQQAIDHDPEPDDQKLMATPGHLAAQITLLLSGLVNRPAQHRAELFCTLLWVRVHQEVTRGHIDRDLLSSAERTRLDHLQANLRRDGGWRWPTPLEPRSLIATLARLAVSQQHLDPLARQRRLSGASDAWAMTATLDSFRNPPRLPPVVLDVQGDSVRSTENLLRAAEQLNVLRSNPDGTSLTWTHQLYLELFAALVLSPEGGNDGTVWLDIQPLAPSPMDQLWKEHQRELLERKKSADVHQSLPFRLPPVPESSDVAETLRYLAQLRGQGQLVSLVDRVTSQHPELAARLALDNLGAFGEARSMTLDAWRPPGEEGPDRCLLNARGCTHPVLNRLRRALLTRMTDKAVHPASRLACGDLLGELGGDPRFEICGKALILKDEYWQVLGAPSGGYSFLMGSENVNDALTVDGKLLPVTLQTFWVAGLLLTNMQFRCFIESGDYHAAEWWPGSASAWHLRQLAASEIATKPWSIQRRKGGLLPVTGSYWTGQAYALWEHHQRTQATRNGDEVKLRLPTEAELEAVQRCHVDSCAAACRERWRFPYTAGIYDEQSGSYVDVRPWHFNHAQIAGFRSTPVGMWVDSSVGPMSDLAGNVWVWTSSQFWPDLDSSMVSTPMPETVDSMSRRVVRGGSFDNLVESCTVHSRFRALPGLDSDYIGFRFVMS